MLCEDRAFALYGGYEEGPRTFAIGKEYFLDELSFQPLPSVLDDWYEAELRPGGADGWRLAFGSLNTFDEWTEQELELEYPFAPPWHWSFRYEQGQNPGGRYERAWVGVRSRLDSGWSLGLAVTPDGDKEFVDLGLAFGRESLQADGVRLRWEARVVFPDCWYNEKNHANASFERRPVDLQLSLLGSWGSGSWLAVELDRDLPFEKTYGENSDAPAGEQNYVFSFENFEATLRGSLKLPANNTLLTRFVVLSADTRRDYFAPGDPTEDYDSEYDLWIAGLEWWRRLDERNEVSFGYEYVDFDECTRRPNDPADGGGARDRTDHILYVRHRRRLKDRLWLTTGLWNDFLERVRWDFDGGKSTVVRGESKISFSLETVSALSDEAAAPGTGPRSTRFVLGLFIELDNPGAGGYLQFAAVF